MTHGFPLPALVVGAALVLGAPARAPAQQAGFLAMPTSVQGVTINDIRIDLRGTTGDPARDREVEARVRAELGIAPGQMFEQPIFDSAVLRARRVPGVRNATYRLDARWNPDAVVLTVTVDVQKGPVAEGPAGLLADGTAFPLLWRDDRVMLTAMLNGGMGAFTDTNPWFGQPLAFTKNNPLVQRPPLGTQTGASASWVEGSVEYGLAGAWQIGDSAFYGYGALSTVTVGSAGRDIFRSDTRTTTNIEKAYAGLLYVDPRGAFNASLSGGRQNFSLNDGFLISQFGSQSNAGPRPGVYLAPRTTLDMSLIGRAAWNGWTLQAFYLDPNEYEPLESNTTVLGANLRYAVTPSFYGNVTVYGVPTSDTRYRTPSGGARPREGLTTVAGHLRWADAAVLKGLWLEGELAHQTSADFPMDAWAGYGTIGYLASDLPWSPSLSSRVSYFSGDNPGTTAFERFDPLYSGGLSEWLQGISINKLFTPANRVSHRLRANVSPFRGLDITADWFIHRADWLNNAGANPALAQLSSSDLGQEVQATVRWSVNANLYFLGIVGHAVPGRAIKDATPTGSAKPWSTFQAQLFWFF